MVYGGIVWLVVSSLFFSGFDSCARFWDLRSGKCIMVFEGHLKNVLALDFSPNGFVILSLSGLSSSSAIM